MLASFAFARLEFKGKTLICDFTRNDDDSWRNDAYYKYSNSEMVRMETLIAHLFLSTALVSSTFSTYDKHSSKYQTNYSLPRKLTAMVNLATMARDDSNWHADNRYDYYSQRYG